MTDETPWPTLLGKDAGRCLVVERCRGDQFRAFERGGDAGLVLVSEERGRDRIDGDAVVVMQAELRLLDEVRHGDNRELLAGPYARYIRSDHRL